MIFLSYTLSCKILGLSAISGVKYRGAQSVLSLKYCVKATLHGLSEFGVQKKSSFYCRHSCISRLTVTVICVRQKANWALSLISCLSSSLGDKVPVSVTMIKMLAFEVMAHIQSYGNLSIKSRPLPEILRVLNINSSWSFSSSGIFLFFFPPTLFDEWFLLIVSVFK